MLEEHLGGHGNKTHQMKVSLIGVLDTLGIETYPTLDVAPGGMVELAEQKGLKVLGVDGDLTLERKIPIFIT